MRLVLIVASLAASLVLAGCGISSSSSAPLRPAPTPGIGERPAADLVIGAGRGDAPLNLRVFDRSFALTSARSATPAELADVEPLEGHTIEPSSGDGRAILLMWAGSQCPQSGDLFIGPGVSEIVIAPTAGPDCAAGANVRSVILEFKLGVDLAAIKFELRPRSA